MWLVNSQAGRLSTDGQVTTIDRPSCYHTESEEEAARLRAELRSLRLDNAETEELVDTNRQLDAANKELGAALDAEVLISRNIP